VVNDTIAGISTAVGNAGISVIRMSGPKAFEIADSLFRGKKKVTDQQSHTVQYGKIIYPETGEVVDEVLLTKMVKPRTYTREDVVEISSHGGYTIAGALLSLLFKQGARPAEPGEFTKRAFLNGRIDLSQAEAIMDIIQARTQRVSKVAVKQLEGTLSNKINNIREKLINLLSHIEVNLDYPEYDHEEITLEKTGSETENIIKELDTLIDSFHFGKLLREGMEIVILGRPNVGKSSLMNRLTRKNRSIVTDIPGTTRDVIEEYINIKGIPVKLFDTAGVRKTSETVEQLGVQRSYKALEESDFAIVLMDVSEPRQKDDERLIQKVIEEDKPYVIVYNKIDLLKEQKEMDRLKGNYPDALFISVARDIGINELEDYIANFATNNNQDIDNQVLVTNARHEHMLRSAKEHLLSVLETIRSGLTLDIVALDLKSALDKLGKITGHHADQDVVDAIFSRFCIGK
jgi:tRNA modification GTPase